MSFETWRRARTERVIADYSEQRRCYLSKVADIDAGTWTHEGADALSRVIDVTAETRADYLAQASSLSRAISMWQAELDQWARPPAQP